MSRQFGQQTPQELEEARQIATEKMKVWGDLPNEAIWKQFLERGIWNDHVAVQSALQAVMDRNDMQAEMEREIKRAFGAGFLAGYCTDEEGVPSHDGSCDITGAADAAFEEWRNSTEEASCTLATAHSDDVAVNRFAECMKAKLAKARENGRDGWDDPDRCSVEMLCDLLLEHLEKGNDGNYVDIANLAMMLHLRCASSELLRREVLRRDARMKAEVLEKAMYKALSGVQPLTAHWLHEMAEAYRRQAEEGE